MRDLLRKARTRVGVAVIGGALLAVGGTATAAVVTSSPDTAEVADVAPLTNEPAATTPEVAVETPAVEVAVPVTPAPVEPPVAAPVAPQTATVDDVTEPQIADPESIGTTGPNGIYTPAPPKPVPGEPPVGVDDVPRPIADLPANPPIN